MASVTWKSNYNEQVWCEECQGVYDHGPVGDDQRMRCPKGHDSIGPWSPDISVTPEVEELVKGLIELERVLDDFASERRCPVCGERPARIDILGSLAGPCWDENGKEYGIISPTAEFECYEGHKFDPDYLRQAVEP